MPKKRAVQKKKVGPGGPNTASASVHTLTAAEIKRLVGTQVRQSNNRLKQQLPATIRDTIQTTISSVVQNGWLGPQQPVAPIGIPPDEPDVRMWEYTPGYNVNWQPRKYQPYSFPQLIWIAQNFDLLAEVIERRKDEVMTSQWELLDDEGVVPDEEQNAVTRALEYPDRIHPFSTWVRMLLHGMYTIDAACIYIHRTLDGGVYSLDLPDGSTITPLIGEDGKPPQPPDPAYLQVIYGTPYSLLTQPSGDLLVQDDQGRPLDATELSRNELLYCPRNPRPQSPLYGWCYDSETEILTKDRGFIRFSGLTPRDEVATRNPMTCEFEWQYPTAYLNEPYSGSMYHFTSRSMDMMVTPEHRMLVSNISSDGRPRIEKIMTAAEFATGLHHERKIPVTSRWSGGEEIGPVRFEAQNYKQRTIEISGDDFCALMGAYLAEGNPRSAGGIEVAQHAESKGFVEYKALFERINLTGESGHNGKAFIASYRAMTDYFAQFGHAYEKFVPDEIRNAPRRQLEIFWRYFTLGDGCYVRGENKSGRGSAPELVEQFTTTSRRLADHLTEIAQKLGRSVSMSLRPARECVFFVKERRYGTPRRESYHLSCRYSEAMAVESEQIAYEGSIHCVSVPNGIVYVRRNGKPAWSGNSQVEQALMTIAIGIKLEQSSLYYYTAGNIPESLIGVPDTWNPKQIASFQSYFDAMLRGNIKRRSGSAIFVPGGMKAAMMKEYGFSREQWEWLARVVCATFHVAPTPYIQAMSRANAESAAVMQLQEGLQPDLTWLTDVMNLVMKVGFRTKLRFAYKDDSQFDPDKKATADKTDIQGGVRTIAEVREERGYDPYPAGVGDKPFVVTASGITLVQDIEGQSAAATQTAQSKAELAANPPPPPPMMAPGQPPPGQQANGKAPAPQQAEAKPATPPANGNGKAPAAKDQAEKLLDYGGAQRIIRKDGRRYMDVGDFLVPLNDDEGRALL